MMRQVSRQRLVDQDKALTAHEEHTKHKIEKECQIVKQFSLDTIETLNAANVNLGHAINLKVL